mgnify:CR=1 FL=1
MKVPEAATRCADPRAAAGGAGVSRLVLLFGGTLEVLLDQSARRGWTAWRLPHEKVAGSELLPVPTTVAALERENLFFVPPQRVARTPRVPT